MTASAAAWAALTPLLIVVWLVQRIPGVRGIPGLILALLVGLGVLFNQWFGQWLPFWSASMDANVSVVMAVLLAAGIAERACGKKIFREHEWRSVWIFGACAAFALYPSALGLGLRNFDSYSLGWPWLEWEQSLLLFGPVAATSGFLVWRGNRFGWVLALSAILFSLRLRESGNFWDYLLDPLYAVVSLLVVAAMLVRRLWRR